MLKVIYIQIQEVNIYYSASKAKISDFISRADKSARVIFHFKSYFLR